MNGKTTRETTKLLFRRAKDEGRQTPRAIIHSRNTRGSPALSAGPWSVGSLGEEQIVHLSLSNASSALHHGVMDISCKQATPAWCNAAIPLQSPAAHAQSVTSQGTDHNGAPERALGLHQARSRGSSECSSCSKHRTSLLQRVLSAGDSLESSCFWKGHAQKHCLQHNDGSGDQNLCVLRTSPKFCRHASPGPCTLQELPCMEEAVSFLEVMTCAPSLLKACCNECAPEHSCDP